MIFDISKWQERHWRMANTFSSECKAPHEHSSIAAVNSSCHPCANWFQTDPDEQYMKLKIKPVSRSPSDRLKFLLSIIFTHTFVINTFRSADTCCFHISKSSTFLCCCLQFCEFTYALYLTHGASFSHRWKEGTTCDLSKWELINNHSVLKLSPARSWQMARRNLKCNVIFDLGLEISRSCNWMRIREIPWAGWP